MSVDAQRRLQVRVGEGLDSCHLVADDNRSVVVSPPRAVAAMNGTSAIAGPGSRGIASPAVERDKVPAGTWHGTR